MGVKQSKRSVDITTAGAAEDGDHATAGVIHMHEDGAKAALNGNAPTPTTPANDAANDDSVISGKKKAPAADGVHQESGAENDGVGGEGTNHVTNGEAEADENGAAKQEAEGADGGKNKKKKEKKVKKKWSLRSISFSRKDRTKPQQQVPPSDAAKDDDSGEATPKKDVAETVAEGQQKEAEKADGVAAADKPAQKDDDKGEPKTEVVEEKMMNGASEVKEEQKGDAEVQQVVIGVDAATPSTAVASPVEREDGDEVPPPLPTTPPPTEPQVEGPVTTGGEGDAARVPADTSTVACAIAAVEAVVPPCSKATEGTAEVPVAPLVAPEEPTLNGEEEAPVTTEPEAIPQIASQPPVVTKDVEEQEVQVEVVAQTPEAPKVEEEESREEAPKESPEEVQKEVAEEAQKEVAEEVTMEAQKVVAEGPEEEVGGAEGPEAMEAEQGDALVVPPSVNILPPSPAPQPEEPATETQAIESSEPLVDGSPEVSEVVVSKIEECSKVMEETKTELSQEIQGEE